MTTLADVTYKVLIGMEVHVQLATHSKMFTGAASGFGGEPNSQVDPIILGLPGVLPVINKRAVEMAIMVGLALECEIAQFTKWDRKSYYYPDLPKNYQISQYDLPLCGVGVLDMPLPDGTIKRVNIRRAHLEEDAGKLGHEGSPDVSHVDMNRAGTPLLEIVTEPDLQSPEEARIFGEELRRICRYLGVSQGIMQQGNMRFEPNINLHITWQGKVYKTPISEIKNLNSFRAVERASAYEIQRQLAQWHADGRVQQPMGKATRGWDDETGQTVLQREKEEAHDYRYFPDPDLVPLTTTPAWIAQIRTEMVELPIARRKRYMQDYGASVKEATALVEERSVAELFEDAIKAGGNPRRVINLILGVGAKLANDQGESATISSLKVPPEAYAKLSDLMEGGVISASSSVPVFTTMFQEQSFDPLDVSSRLGLLQVRDVGQTETWVQQALDANPKAVEDAKNNPKKQQASLGFLRGQVMKLSGGKADPKLVGELLEKKLKN
jgi:aspartyl-tRNA(Asn)/glutamyl-tRNA(Gln) amidotransferase subunit B